MSRLVTTLRGAYRLVVGGGEPGLIRRKEYHIRRQVAEQAVLQEAKVNRGMFTTVACPACGQPEASDRFVSPAGFSFSDRSRRTTAERGRAPCQ